MTLTVHCPGCETALAVEESLVGRKVRCTKCKAVFEVQAPAGARSDAEEETRPVRRRGDDEAIQERAPDDESRPSRRTYEDDEGEEEERPRRRRRRRRRFDGGGAPHRGGMILTMGIFSIVLSCEPIVGIALGAGAVNMANTDLNQMREGRMDEFGEGTTKGGQICAYIGIALSIIMFIVGLVLRLGRFMK